jgi:copper homeostasis protein (lipoprotein)
LVISFFTQAFSSKPSFKQKSQTMKCKNQFCVVTLTIATILFSCSNDTKNTESNLSQPAADSAFKKDSIIQTPDATHSSANSLDWAGTYKGTVPCADCEGIETTLTIDADSNYVISTQYLGKKKGKGMDKKAHFSWNKEGSVITLEGIKNAPSQYQVGENMLIQLDMQGKQITGDNAALYQLIKQPAAAMTTSGKAETTANATLTGRYWKLTELMGKNVEAGTSTKEIFVKFDDKAKKVNGNSGCNNFFGSYETVNDYKINFSKMGSTKMACPKMDLERDFLNAFEKADSYIIKDNKLQLVKARMAPLAVFEAAMGK